MNKWVKRGLVFFSIGIFVLCLANYILSYGSINVSLYVFGVVIGMTVMGYWMFALSCFLKSKGKTLSLSEE